MNNVDTLSFRSAKSSDAALILTFIKELAEYEKMSDKVEASKEDIEKNVFEKEYAKVLFPLLNGKEIGFALFFFNYSTWLGKPGLYIEDLYIRPEYRHRGYGKRTMKELSRIALENGCGRLEWWCLDENTPAVAFYEEGLKAEAMRDWTTFRLEKDSIKNLLKT